MALAVSHFCHVERSIPLLRDDSWKMRARDSSTKKPALSEAEGLGMTKVDALKPRRQLGLFDATMIVMGGIVGAGIFANPSEVAHDVRRVYLG